MLLCKIFHNGFSIDWDGMCYAVVISLSDDFRTHCLWSDRYSRQITLFTRFPGEKLFDVDLPSDIYGLISFKACIMIDTTKTYILIPV